MDKLKEHHTSDLRGFADDQPSEKVARMNKEKLAKTIMNGKGKFKYRTPDGAFNEFIIHNKKP